uniref:Uncharacterized protein n=1 Tax=Sphaerodactylus townsendi TaxID=933632 RepID=A0ACB8FTW1_9SAUR
MSQASSSFDKHSDEDDLPPALAAAVGASPPPSSTSPGSQKTSGGQFSSCAKSPTDAGNMFALEPGDLLMDFTEATPMVNDFVSKPWKIMFG